jgi:hypothetical protein
MDKQELKKTRKMTICSFSGKRALGYSHFSELRIRGKWLKDMGFESGQVVTITCRHRELIIRTDGTRKYNERSERVG